MAEALTSPQFDLVIFDCDGVLVDSEMLSAGVLMGMMEEVGLPITPEMFRSDFLGRSFASASARVSERFGRPLPEDFNDRYRTRLLATMRGNLHAMQGVERVLQSMAVPFCLATSSSPQRLDVSLTESALGRHFEGRCFTASQVKNGKPAPDLMFFAAHSMKTNPKRCLVIEDSEMGIRSGVSAGMTVWQFAGGSHIKAGYAPPENLGVHRAVGSMDDLHRLFCDAGLCRE
jgi:HAD superfamily hydrolase (TIGR01509 family)